MFRKSRRKPGRGPETKQTGPRFVAVPDHRRRRMVLLRPPGTLVPRIAALALVVLVLAAVVVKSEVWPEESDAPPVSMAETGLLVQQGKMAGPDTENAPSLGDECPDPNPVWEGEARGDLETNLFEVGTDRFIVSYEVLERPQERGLPTFSATIEDEDGRSISSDTIPSPQPGEPVRKDLLPNMGRTIVDAEPGSYRLKVSPGESDQKYALTVEECGVPEVS